MQLYLSVQHSGLALYQWRVRVNSFNWSRIRKFQFQKKKFTIRFKLDTDDQVSRCPIPLAHCPQPTAPPAHCLLGLLRLPPVTLLYSCLLFLFSSAPSLSISISLSIVRSCCVPVSCCDALFVKIPSALDALPLPLSASRRSLPSGLCLYSYTCNVHIRVVPFVIINARCQKFCSLNVRRSRH